MHGTSIVLYGVGSPVVVDLEVSLARAGLTLAAGVRNVAGEVWLGRTAALVDREDLSPALCACPFLVPLFTPGHRQHAAAEATAAGFRHPFTLVDPTSVTPPGWTPGPGTYINAGCTVGAASHFAEFVFVNRGASIGHHVSIGPYVSIGPGAIITGQATIDLGAFIGAGAVILPAVRIGANAVVAAGAVVAADVPAHALVSGNPARVVRTGIPGYHEVTVTAPFVPCP